MQIEFKDIAALSVFADFQRLARRIFGLTLGLTSPDFSTSRLFSPRSEMNPFCLALQKTREGARRCRQCDRHIIHATAQGTVSAGYECHAGLSEFAIPIRVDNRVVAVLQCGQVLKEAPTAAGWKRTVRLLEGWTGDWCSLKEKWQRTRVLDPDVQDDVIALLQLFAEHVVAAYSRLQLLNEGGQSQAIARARAYIANHFSTPLSINAIARHAGTSPRNLSRLFVQETGGTVLAFVHEIRLRQACEELALTARSIAEIALDCGFGSVQQFNRVFRKSHQCTPTRWREIAARAPAWRSASQKAALANNSLAG